MSCRLMARFVGIGEEGFGWRRGALLAAGVVVAGAARYLAAARKGGTEPPADEDDTPSASRLAPPGEPRRTYSRSSITSPPSPLSRLADCGH